MIRLVAGENTQMALDAVWTHRVRSALTILGIIIGITTVVAVGSITNGLRQGIITFFEEFGPDNLFINRVSGDPSSPGTLKERKRKNILPEYADQIKQQVRAVDDTALQLFMTSDSNGLLTAKVPGFETDNIYLVGFSANSWTIQPRELTLGRVFTPEEEERSARVAVIGSKVAEALFPEGKPLGRLIMIAGTEYEVIGVGAEAKGGFFGQNGFDIQIAIPYKTAASRFPTEKRLLIVAKARPGMKEEAQEEIRALLRRIRNTPAKEEDDFALTTADQIVQRLDSILSIAVLVSVALGSIGLLVGGIGVMNIMLVSVTERTKEIGIRKAIGAKRSDIVVQFLTEAMTLTALGGVIGVVFAMLLVALIGKLVPALPAVVPTWTWVSGLAVSISVGLFFGVWPALKAARLDPVEALRYE